MALGRHKPGIVVLAQESSRSFSAHHATELAIGWLMVRTRACVLDRWVANAFSVRSREDVYCTRGVAFERERQRMWSMLGSLVACTHKCRGRGEGTLYRNNCGRVPTSGENAKKKKVHTCMHKRVYIYRHFYDRTLHVAAKREPTQRVLRAISPAGSHLERQDTHTYQHTTYSNPR